MLKDKLVHFSGDVIGNTVLGTADRTYIAGNDWRPSAPHSSAGALTKWAARSTIIKPDSKYGSAYEIGDWGGVFGASKTGGSSNNTFRVMMAPITTAIPT